jgi:hypothetical protein
MVLLVQELERYGISEATVKDLLDGKGHPYEVIDIARKAFFEEEYPKTVKFVREIKGDHNRAAEVLNAMRALSKPQPLEQLQQQQQLVHEYLLTANTCHDATDEPACRTQVWLDATGSMAGLISLAKQTIGTVFKRTFDVLGQKTSGLSIQMGVYRNYSATDSGAIPEDLLVETSPWESSPEPLFTFLHGVVASHGWGKEAVELGLYHALQEHARDPIRQVIIIGDAPPNTREEATLKRGRGPAVTRFPDPVYFDEQRAALLEAGVIIHAIYIDTHVSRSVCLSAECGGRVLIWLLLQGLVWSLVRTVQEAQPPRPQPHPVVVAAAADFC